ncbi:MAG: hypothetical protein JW815_00540 [Candidatus Bathyarchaeota archaeon]|nr:hypothetical protein [Candidatus Bathyarchaeum sp.]
MVKPHTLLVTLSVLFILVTLVGTVSAQRQYQLDHEYAEIWINPEDGTIDLLYDISLTLNSGSAINYVYIGQPTRDFDIGTAENHKGNTLSASDASSGSDYKVRVDLNSPLTAGKTVRFSLITNVAGMIWEDTQNSGNVGMQFTPTWWDEASVLDLRVLIVLPSGVTQDMVKTSVDWNNIQLEDGRLTIYWERSLSPGQKADFGVSFPKEYVDVYKTRDAVSEFVQEYLGVLLLFGVVGIGVIVVLIISRKSPYKKPTIGVEALGIRRGLTAVEASYLLDMKPTQIVTEILYSLLKKRAVWAEVGAPVLELRIMDAFKNKTGTPEVTLRYYEIDFLNAIKDDGTLDEEKLAQIIMFLRQTVEEKLRGYCRSDTINYYQKMVTKAWEQVEQAGTAELSSKAYDEQLLWLLLDPNVKARTETAFDNLAFQPSPLWLWYWYSYRYYHPRPTYEPNIKTPNEAAKPPTIPGADFANDIATAVENTSNNIVTNLEKFANSILPMAPPKSSRKPAHHKSSCVCACASCACACACVSCACACAGGGVG